MKTLIAKRVAAIATAAVAASGIHLALAAEPTQSVPGYDTHPVTRAELLREVQKLRSAGYDPSDDNFPESLQKAQRKLDAKRQAEKSQASSSGGGSVPAT